MRSKFTPTHSRASIFAGQGKRRLAAAAIMAASAVLPALTTVGQNAPPTTPVKPAKPTPYTLSGVYTLSGKADKTAAQTYSSDTKDVSAIYVKSNGDLTLTDPVVTTAGATSSIDNSSMYGLNAAVLAAKAKIKVTGGSITTAGPGANAVYATGSGATVSLAKTTISATGEGAHGAIASAGGSITLTDIDIATSGINAAAVATDKGGGTITITNGTITTAGDKSPVVYATGTMKITGATLSATGAEAVTVDGKGSVTLVDSKLTGSKGHGVLIFQNSPTEIQGVTGTFNMKGGSLTANDGPLFMVTNTTANIMVSGVTLNASSGLLVKAAPDDWGVAGSNGGSVNFTADHETLTGDLLATSPGTVVAILKNQSTLTGNIKGAAIALDSTSTWTLTSDSTITVLADAQGAPGDSFANIIGNSHDAHYDASLSGNAWLKGKTYNLASAGRLIPLPGTSHFRNDNDYNNNNNNNNHGYGGTGGAGGGGGGHH